MLTVFLSWDHPSSPFGRHPCPRVSRGQLPMLGFGGPEKPAETQVMAHQLTHIVNAWLVYNFPTIHKRPQIADSLSDASVQEIQKETVNTFAKLFLIVPINILQNYFRNTLWIRNLLDISRNQKQNNCGTGLV